MLRRAKILVALLGLSAAATAAEPPANGPYFGGGFGVRWYATPNFALTAQTDVFVWEDDSLGPTLDISVGATQLAVQYIF